MTLYKFSAYICWFTSKEMKPNETMGICFFLLVLTSISNGWQVVSFWEDNQIITAYIPEDQIEEEAAMTAGASPYKYYEEGQEITAYIFPDNPAVSCTGSAYNGIAVGYGSFEAPMMLLTQNSFSTSSLNPLAEPFYPKKSVKKIPVEAKLLLFSLRNIQQHCRDHAFRYCFYRNCKYEHIDKSNLKDRVICFRQIDTGCFRKNCCYYHLSESQVLQAKNARSRGLFIPLIFCNKTHSSEFEKSDCPYLHFEDDE